MTYTSQFELFMFLPFFCGGFFGGGVRGTADAAGGGGSGGVATRFFLGASLGDQKGCQPALSSAYPLAAAVQPLLMATIIFYLRT